MLQPELWFNIKILKTISSTTHVPWEFLFYLKDLYLNLVYSSDVMFYISDTPMLACLPSHVFSQIL